MSRQEEEERGQVEAETPQVEEVRGQEEEEERGQVEEGTPQPAGVERRLQGEGEKCWAGVGKGVAEEGCEQRSRYPETIWRDEHNIGPEYDHILQCSCCI